MALIELNNVTFKYKKASTYALNNVNLSLNEGQIVGLLGPNGSGKTTLIKAVAGLLRNTKGALKINDNFINENTKSIVSYLPDFTYLDETKKITDVISFFKDVYSDFDDDKMLKMLNTMSINPQSVIKTLSKGNKEKLQLALVLSRNAKIYLLDEPIGGVDPAQRDFIISTILSNYAQNSLVIISTHLIEDIESILDRAIFIRNGQIIIDDTVENITATHENKNLNEVFKEVFKCGSY